MKLLGKLALSTALAASAFAIAAPAQAAVIKLIDIGGAAPTSQAGKAFGIAARFWGARLTNNVFIRLNVGFSQLPPNVLGSTGSITNVAAVQDVFGQISSTGNSALDAIAVANLPTLTPGDFAGADALSPIISGPKPNGFGVATNPLVSILDNDGSGNNSFFSANTANLKALGFTPTYNPATNPNLADGTVRFSNQFAFDFSPQNGIDADKFDFIGIAIHEIGHALGFRSGVDTYDVNTNFNGDLNNFAINSIWDSFRYSGDGQLNWAIGGTPYFSIDGGATIFNGGILSTGRNFGDGQQASHWKDNLPGDNPLGLLDPTVRRGFMTSVTSLDLAAFDAMGYNLDLDVFANQNLNFSTRDIAIAAGIPEPGIWAQMILGFGLLGGLLRRRRRGLQTVAA